MTRNEWSFMFHSAEWLLFICLLVVVMDSLGVPLWAGSIIIFLVGLLDQIWLSR